jgi:ABC-2 type transport system permease protein
VTALRLDDLPPLLENGNRPPQLLGRIRDIWNYRELLSNLVRRELKVKYKDSILGFLWTLLNPLLYLVVFSVVFDLILGSTVPRYGLLLLSGLLAYNLFSIGLTAATTSITANGPLVQKVWFPREILPLAAVGANLITFFFQLIVLGIGLAVLRQSPEWSMLWLTVPALIVTLLMAIGLGLLLSGLNVYFRDVQHFLELGLLTWFWFTPIVYPFQRVAQYFVDESFPLGERIAMLNPMIPVVTTFQRVVYNPTNFTDEPDVIEDNFRLLIGPDGDLHGSLWYLGNLGVAAVFGVVFVYIGFKVFTRVEANLGEEL